MEWSRAGCERDRDRARQEERASAPSPIPWSITPSLGFGLFKMWVGALMAKDEPLMAQISEELAYFSKLGDLSALEGAPYRSFKPDSPRGSS